MGGMPPPKCWSIGYSKSFTELFPAEQRRILELLLERVDVFTERVDIKFKTEGLGRMVQELLSYKKSHTEAA